MVDFIDLSDKYESNLIFNSKIEDSLSYQNLNSSDLSIMQSIINGTYHKRFGGKRIHSYELRLNELETRGFDFTNTASVRALHSALKSTPYQKKNLHHAINSKKIIHHLRQKVSNASKRARTLEDIANSEILSIPPCTSVHPSYLVEIPVNSKSVQSLNSSYGSKFSSMRKLGIAATIMASLLTIDSTYANIAFRNSLTSKVKQVLVGKFNEVMDNGYFNASNIKGQSIPVKVSRNFHDFFKDNTPFKKRVKLGQERSGLVQSSNRSDEGSLMRPIDSRVQNLDSRYRKIMAESESRNQAFEIRADNLWLQANPPVLPSFKKIASTSHNMASVLNSKRDEIYNYWK